ncbi:MAG: GumC family protein [bacterium]
METYFTEETDLAEEDSLDLQRYYRALKRRWWLILLITIVISVPWALYLKSQPPVYEATALIRFNGFAGKEGSLIESRKTELTSRSFAERVVAQLGLSMSFELAGEQMIKRNQIFSDFTTSRKPVPGHYSLRLYEDQTFQLAYATKEEPENFSEILSGTISDITKEYTSINGFSFKLVNKPLTLPVEIPFKVDAFRKAVKSFQSRIKVNVNRAGTLMSVTLSDTDPNLVAEMTNRLAEIFIEQSAKMKNEGITGRRKILESQLKLIKQKLDESDNALKNFKEKYATYLNTDENRQVNEVVNLTRRREKTKEMIQTLQDLLAKMDEEFPLGDDSGDSQADKNRRYIMIEIVGHSAFNDDATMLIYRQQLKDLEQEWKKIVAGTSAQNRKAREILKEIYQLHSKIEVIARQEIQNLESSVLAIDNEIAASKYRLEQMPTQQRLLAELTRNNKVLEKQYTELLAKTQDAQISEAVTSDDAEILDTAIVPEFPTNRDKKKNAAIGTGFAFFLGIGLVLLLEFFDKSIKTADDVKRCLKIPLLGTIPQIDFSEVFDFQDSEKIKQIDQQLVTHDYSPTPVGEAYRSLRTNLMFSKENGRTQSFVITSNEPGDGKSFTAANLAITLAQLKSNTLLIDSDLRRGVLHNTFGVSKEPGFSNYLTGVVPLHAILHETHVPNLTLISCGSLIPNPSELLGSHQMQRFLDEVRRKYELIIFDTPPLNAATDAVVVGTQVDAAVIVIRAGKTDRDLARQKLELFKSVPAKVIGTILNGTTADMAHPGYSYYHY